VASRSETVSIIIAVMNGAATIHRCLASVVAQTYPQKEIIVIDGGSTDGTADIIRAFEGELRTWRSEPDHGIYDAWNKGVAEASGDWVCFIGADDWYPDDGALAAMMSVANRGDREFVSGRCMVVGPDGEAEKVFGLPWAWRRERKRHFICHPGSLHRKALLAGDAPFDRRYRICADYDVNLRRGPLLKAGFVDRVTLCVGAGGVSRKQHRATIMETTLIQIRHPDIGPVRGFVNRIAMLTEMGVYGLLSRLGLQRRVREWLIRTGLLRR
jgi:glycosyltransferase involved in cell wall biosynthesis